MEIYVVVEHWGYDGGQQILGVFEDADEAEAFAAVATDRAVEIHEVQ